MGNDMNDLGTIIECITTVVVFALIPFLAYCVVNIATLKADMKWVVGGLKMLGDKAGVLLHSPHSEAFDAFIEKFWHGSLTQDEAKELVEKLDKIVHEDSQHPIYDGIPYTEAQKTAAASMMASVKILFKF
jgi:hypothetical protein